MEAFSLFIHKSLRKAIILETRKILFTMHRQNGLIADKLRVRDILKPDSVFETQTILYKNNIDH